MKKDNCPMCLELITADAVMIADTGKRLCVDRVRTDYLKENLGLEHDCFSYPKLNAAEQNPNKVILLNGMINYISDANGKLDKKVCPYCGTELPKDFGSKKIMKNLIISNDSQIPLQFIQRIIKKCTHYVPEGYRMLGAFGGNQLKPLEGRGLIYYCSYDMIHSFFALETQKSDLLTVKTYCNMMMQNAKGLLVLITKNANSSELFVMFSWIRQMCSNPVSGEVDIPVSVVTIEGSVAPDKNQKFLTQAGLLNRLSELSKETADIVNKYFTNVWLINIQSLNEYQSIANACNQIIQSQQADIWESLKRRFHND